MPASVRLKLFSSELHWLWHNCALSLVYASVNEVLVLLCQLLCRFGSEWWRWYLRAGKECRCNLLIVCQKSYIFLPWTVNWAALMVLVLLEHSPKGAPGSVLCSALGCSLRISHTFLLQGSSGKLISFRPGAGLLLVFQSFCKRTCGRGIAPLWEHAVSLSGN